MNTSMVTVKGQVVIPVKIRKKYGITNGTLIYFNDYKGKLFLLPLTEDSVDKNIGFLKTHGKLKKALLAEKRSEREL